MKKYCLFFLIVFAFMACSKNMSTSGLVGKWEEFESYISPGYATTWQKVNKGNYLFLNTDLTFTIKDSYGVRSGRYQATDSTIIIFYSGGVQGQPQGGIRAHYTIKNNVLELWYDGCDEGCGSRYTRL